MDYVLVKIGGGHATAHLVSLCRTSLIGGAK